jgi:hypothetical protein
VSERWRPTPAVLVETPAGADLRIARRVLPANTNGAEGLYGTRS